MFLKNILHTLYSNKTIFFDFSKIKKRIIILFLIVHKFVKIKQNGLLNSFKREEFIWFLQKIQCLTLELGAYFFTNEGKK